MGHAAALFGGAISNRMVGEAVQSQVLHTCVFCVVLGFKFPLEASCRASMRRFEGTSQSRFGYVGMAFPSTKDGKEQSCSVPMSRKLLRGSVPWKFNLQINIEALRGPTGEDGPRPLPSRFSGSVVSLSRTRPTRNFTRTIRPVRWWQAALHRARMIEDLHLKIDSELRLQVNSTENFLSSSLGHSSFVVLHSHESIQEFLALCLRLPLLFPARIMLCNTRRQFQGATEGLPLEDDPCLACQCDATSRKLSGLLRSDACGR